MARSGNHSLTRSAKVGDSVNPGMRRWEVVEKAGSRTILCDTAPVQASGPEQTAIPASTRVLTQRRTRYRAWAVAVGVLVVGASYAGGSWVGESQARSQNLATDEQKAATSVGALEVSQTTPSAPKKDIGPVYQALYDYGIQMPRAEAEDDADYVCSLNLQGMDFSSMVYKVGKEKSIVYEGAWILVDHALKQWC